MLHLQESPVEGRITERVKREEKKAQQTTGFELPTICLKGTNTTTALQLPRTAQLGQTLIE